MPEAIAFAATAYGLPPLDALTAATANPAWVLGLQRPARHPGVGQAGRRPGAGGPSFAQVPYRPGHDPVVATLVGGELVA